MSAVIARDLDLTFGIDVDSKHLVIAIRHNGAVMKQTVVPNEDEAITKFIARFPGCRIRAAYEAGPHGFHLYDLLTSIGVDCTVAAPCDIPKPSKRKSKTNRIDARKLADLHEDRKLTAVIIPSPEQRAHRQLLRTFRQAKKQRSRIMAQIKSELLFHNLRTPKGLSASWGKAYLAWLEKLDLSEVTGGQQIRDSLASLVRQYRAVTEEVDTLKQQIKKLAATKRYARRFAALDAHPGVGLGTAMTVLTETPSARPFANSKRYVAYLGLQPLEHSTGDDRHMGHISHAGNSYMRFYMVQAAKQWVKVDPAARDTFRRLCKRRDRNRATVAMARRLATRIYWTLRHLEKSSAQ